MSAGKNDATNDYEAVGHSSRARRLLKKYRIGRLRSKEDDEEVKIDVKSHSVKSHAHHHHHHHHHNASDNIWLKDQPPGTKYVGKSGRSFNAVCFGWTPAMVFMAPTDVELEPDDLEGLERVYWIPRGFAPDSTLKNRRNRFHASNRPWLIVLMTYLLTMFGGFRLDNFAEILNLVTVTLCMVAVSSLFVLTKCRGLAYIPRLVLSVPVFLCGITFATILTLLVHIGVYGDLVTCRFSMLCITWGFLSLTFPMSHPKGMGGSWYLGKIRDRMEYGHFLILCGVLEMALLSRGGGLLGIFMGITLGLSIAYQNRLVTVAIQIVRGRVGILACSVVIVSACFSVLFRILCAMSSLTPSSDLRNVFMSLDEKVEGDIDITKCLGFLGFAFLVQVLLSNMITVSSIDNETAAAHLQGMYGAFVLHILMSIWLGFCVIFGSQTLTYYLPAFVRRVRVLSSRIIIVTRKI